MKICNNKKNRVRGRLFLRERKKKAIFKKNKKIR